jgi:hypothetical protein
MSETTLFIEKLVENRIQSILSKINVDEKIKKDVLKMNKIIVSSPEKEETPQKKIVKKISKEEKKEENIREKLEEMTIPKIKEFAKSKEIKVTTMKKDLLIQYVCGVLKERENGIETNTKNANMVMDDLKPVNLKPLKGDWMKHLKEKGWCVVPIPDFDADYFSNKFFDWLEDCCPSFKRNDKNTWKTANLPINLHGIFKHYIGHEEFVWQIREKCKPIFEKIWGTDDLLCSFDGGCFLPPKNGRNSFKQWIHCDQSRFDLDFCCVQGVVNLIDNGEEDGGLVLVDGSQKIFKKYMEKHPSEGLSWFKVDMNDPLISNLPLIKVCAPAGHIILWDSRVFHCNVSPIGKKARMCTYVSMQPRERADKKTLEKRIKLFEEKRMTGHWCYGNWFSVNQKQPRTYGGENKNVPTSQPKPKLNEIRKKMIGY